MPDLLPLVEQNRLFTERRLPSLYSDFRRLKESNEEGYFANIAAWKSLLTEALNQGSFADSLCIDTTHLLTRLTSAENGVPLAVDTVLSELVKDKAFVPLSVYLTQAHPISGRHWGVAPVVSWALRTTGLYDNSWSAGKSGELNSEKYVFMAKVEKVSDEVFTKIKRTIADNPGYSSTVFTRQQFGNLLGSLSKDVKLSHIDTDCIIKFLQRDRGVLVANGEIVKISNEPITEQDKAVANLKATIEQVTQRVDGLSSKIRSCNDKAKQALTEKNKQLARYALQSRKLAQDTQSKSLEMLANLEHVLVQIDSSSDHLEIVTALQSGVSILGNLNKAVGGVDRVSDLMDQIHDNVTETDEIGRELSRMAPAIDEDEIDDELAELEREARRAKVDEQLSKLPPAPEKVQEPEKEQQHEQTDDQVEELIEKSSKLEISDPIPN
uniref:ARAD1D25960p n=1 Tax=Blastobotrys adeninivorans TaxID=409370 RepID=A0A060TGU2_BLAAD